MTTINLKDSFKAYDVRGIVGETITHETVRATGAAFVDVLGLAGQTVLVGGDMRPSSPNSWMHSLKVPPHAAQTSKNRSHFNRCALLRMRY